MFFIRFLIASLLCSSFFIFGESNRSYAQGQVLSEEDRDDEFRERWREVYDKIFEDKILAEWAMDRFMRDIKDDLDARVDELLFDHPFAKELWPTVLKEAQQVNQVYVLKHLGSGSESLDEVDGETVNHPRAKELLRPVMERLPLSQEARAKARLFHIPADTVNAYTWSGIRYAMIQMAMFEGLMSDLPDESVQAVQVHEVSHIMGLHVPVSMALTSIFFATGEILIPESDHHILDSHLQEFAPSLLSNAMGEVHERSSKSIPPAIRKIAQKVKELAIANPEMAADFISKLTDAMEFSSGAQNSIVSGWKASFGAQSAMPADPQATLRAQMAGFDYKAYQEFQGRMADRSRSCEVTCDRMATIVMGPDAAIQAFLILQAGPDASAEAVIKGGDEILRTLAENPELQEYMSDDGASHPNLTARRRAIKSYAGSDSYRIHSDPFLFALTDYIAVSKLLIEHQHTDHERMGELSDRVRADFVRSQYVGMAEKLRDLLIEGIVEEFEADKADMHRFAAVYQALTIHLDHEDEFEEENDVVNQYFVQELRADGRLLPKLIEALQALPQSEKRDQAVELLQELMPLDDPTWGIDGFLKAFSEGNDGGGRSSDLRACARGMIEAGRPGRLARLASY